ncbi:hypothetical protein CWI37_0915p0010 [Hamiltosporidium tvaerminnensis]|uniref:HTH cro/C1-type domain-containing protein n=2 Tax=Hamiltosporidium TaxID=1176354 RepID=A0A4Q9LMF0_9MICR|nr:hypothetical protein CWI36_2618p0010 [Hamiltosporidium magnivora]TBU00736.1 hypothetical protein CWI37_0915p0010 [Hamiltosporidium tvaerminnensis]TBU09474.1 hypothetical protein CWI36_0026p0040 [Hamiltosporidium magnivora]
MPSDFDTKKVVLTKKIPSKPKEIKEEGETEKDFVGKEIGRIIAVKREEKEMTQKQLATRISKPSSLVSEWEHGIAVYDDKIADKFEKVLGIKIKRSNNRK